MLTLKVLPANGGDCLLVSFGKEKSIKNILIDGGIGTTYKKTLKAEIEKIKKAEQSIDLLVVTHSHEDHINGIIKFIEDDKNSDSLVPTVSVGMHTRVFISYFILISHIHSHAGAMGARKKGRFCRD